MSNLPAGWSLVPLDSLGSADRPAVKAGPFGSALKKEFYVQEGYRVYGQEQVIADDFSHGDYFIDAARFQTLRACEVRAGDVLVSLVGTFGKAAIVPDSAAPGIINPRLIRLSLDPRLIEPSFIKRYLESPGVQSYFERIAHGGTMGVLNATTISPLPVRLPPPAEQRRIVAKLDELFARNRAAKASLERLPVLLERLRQAILAAAFRGDFTTNWRGRNAGSVRSALATRRAAMASGRQRVKTSGAGPANPIPQRTILPPEWEWADAAEVVELGAEIVYGIVQPGPQVPDGVPYVRGMDIQDGRILVGQLLRTSAEIAKRYERASLRPGDVLLGIIRATKVAIVPAELAGANITQGTARLRPSSLISTDFLALWLDTAFAQRWLHAHYRGIDMPGLNLADVRRLPVPLAPRDEQDALVTAVHAQLARVDQLAKAAFATSSKLESLERAALAAAFCGELVPQDPNDEPASVLLERIRAKREASQPVKSKRGASPSTPARARPSRRAP